MPSCLTLESLRGWGATKVDGPCCWWRYDQNSGCLSSLRGWQLLGGGVSPTCYWHTKCIQASSTSALQVRRKAGGFKYAMSMLASARHHHVTTAVW